MYQLPSVLLMFSLEEHYHSRHVIFLLMILFNTVKEDVNSLWKVIAASFLFRVNTQDSFNINTSSYIINNSLTWYCIPLRKTYDTWNAIAQYFLSLKICFSFGKSQILLLYLVIISIPNVVKSLTWLIFFPIHKCEYWDDLFSCFVQF